MYNQNPTHTHSQRLHNRLAIMNNKAVQIGKGKRCGMCSREHPAINSGRMLCMWPEGSETRTNTFNRGRQRIIFTPFMVELSIIRSRFRCQADNSKSYYVSEQFFCHLCFRQREDDGGIGRLVCSLFASLSPGVNKQ